MRKVKSLLLVTIIAFSGLFFAFKDDLFQISRNIDIFVALYKQIDVNYVEETKANELVKKGIDGMLAGLDPYTEYVPETELENYKLKYISTQYGGIGVSTILKDGSLFINEIIAGYPADKNGLQTGDEILEIQGLSVKAKTRPEISQLIRGARGTTLTLLLRRDKQTFQKTLVRDEVKQGNVSYSTVFDSKIGYIRLDKFLENSAQDVQIALNEILKQQPLGLILDLRNNGGGILQEAVKILNLFVPQGVTVVNQQGRNPEKNIRYITTQPAIAADLPLVVLINQGSASASEIVAGTLQDLDRAVILGQNSYGKGLVQQTFNLPYNSLVKITVAKYFTASGRCVQALDYAHRQANGSVLKFKDSTRKAFSTKAGRIVYEGNGVAPDLITPARKLSPISVVLLNRNLFFDFANQYKRTHSKIATPAAFRLPDADYQQFVASLTPKDYQYTAKSEKLLADFAAELKNENREASLTTAIEQVRQQLAVAKKSDLSLHQDEIKSLLESQIVGRYYYEKGRIEQAFQYDVELKKAKTLLANSVQMNSILTGDGQFKIIGGHSNGQIRD